MPKKIRKGTKFTEKEGAKTREKTVKKEEITDLINDIKARYTPENFEAMGMKRGKILRFRHATIRITKVAKGRYWGAHVELVNPTVVTTHYGHNVDSTESALAEYGVPYCTDCEVPVDKPRTQAGEKKALDREERTLEDGTIVD